jgi:hypothetical protein
MIITSGLPLQVGKIYTEKDHAFALFEIDGKVYMKYTFLVIRKCTQQEYFDHIKEEYNALPHETLDWGHYFEVSMD